MKFLFSVAILLLFSAIVLATESGTSGTPDENRSNLAFKDFPTLAPQGWCHLLEVENNYNFTIVENGGCNYLLVPAYPDSLTVQRNSGEPSIKIFKNADCSGTPAGVGQDTLNVGGETPILSILIAC